MQRLRSRLDSCIASSRGVFVDLRMKGTYQWRIAHFPVMLLNAWASFPSRLFSLETPWADGSVTTPFLLPPAVGRMSGEWCDKEHVKDLSRCSGAACELPRCGAWPGEGGISFGERGKEEKETVAILSEVGMGASERLVWS